MSLDESITDPTAGAEAGPTEGTQPAAPAAPAGRTYTDADMASARRSFEADAARREAKLRADFEQRFVAREQPKTASPWDQLDPSARDVLRQIFEHELQTRLQPFQQQQEDISFRNDEAEIRSKYPDYAKNRTAVLEFAVQNGIPNLDMAYRAWKYEDFSKIDLESERKRAVADYTKKKTAQSVQTPASESRGGGAPSSQQKFKNREEMDEAVMEMVRQANNS